jgi:WD40 repeat protein
LIIALAAMLLLQGGSVGFAAAASKDYAGFESAVRSVAFSPDEALIYGASDSEIIVFDAVTGRQTARVEVFGPSAVSSRAALRGGIDSFTRIELPALTGGTLSTFADLGFPKTDILGFSALSSDGAGGMVAGIAFRSALIVDGKALPFAHEKFSVTAIAAAPQGKAFAMGSLAGEVRLVDRGAKTLFSTDARAGAVVSLAFSYQGDAFAAGTGDGSVKVYRGDPWWVKMSSAVGGMVYAVAWSAAGDLIAAATARTDGGRIHLIDPGSGKTLAKSDLSTGIYAVSFSSKGDRLALGCEDGTIRVKMLRR